MASVFFTSQINMIHPAVCHLHQIQTFKTKDISFCFFSSTSVFHYFYKRPQMEETEEILHSVPIYGEGEGRQGGKK